MSQAEMLLNNLNENVQFHDHDVKDLDGYFIIDPDTREIHTADGSRNALMQYDHNSEIFTFELPRYIEGHDMTKCNRVRVHFTNIGSNSGQHNDDIAEMTDLAISADDSDKVISTWTIRREATQLAGTLNFLVQYMCVADDGAVVYEWHTDIFKDVEIKTGMNNDEASVVRYTNILEEWYQRLFGTGGNVLTELENEINLRVKTINGVAPDENGNVEIKTEDDIDEFAAVEDLAKTGIVEPLADENNVIFVDENDSIFVL